jgi:hypothetical protein
LRSGPGLQCVIIFNMYQVQYRYRYTLGDKFYYVGIFSLHTLSIQQHFGTG